MESKLIYNEDNLASIKAFLELERKGQKVLDDQRKDLKEPYLRAGRTIDETAKKLSEQLASIAVAPKQKYAALCMDIEKRAREAEADRQRKQQILTGIDSNMVSFSQQISGCQTDKELIEVERRINLEKANKKKYAEFYDQAFEKYGTLTSLLTLQKERIRKQVELEKERMEAEKKGDDEKIMAINEKQVELDAKIEEAKVEVQESALNQSMNTNVISVTESLPEVKARLSRWVWEVQDITQVVKKMPSWTKVETVDEKINEFLKASKDSWVELGKEEVVLNGIKFYLKKTY